MLAASRLSAKIDIGPLLQGDISVSSAQIFGMQAILYKENENAKPNYQFVLDSLASKNQEEKKPLHLNINSLIIRNGHVKYDQLDQPLSEGKISPYHLNLSNISGHFMLYELTDNNIDLKVKKLAMKETTGLDLKRLSFDLIATKKQATLTTFVLETPNSTLNIDTLKADYQFIDNHIDKSTLKFQANIFDSTITPSDFHPLLPTLKNFSGPIHFSMNVHGTHNNLNIKGLTMHAESKALRLSADCILRDWDTQPSWLASIHEFEVNANSVSKISTYFGEHFTIPQQVLRLGNIAYQGEAASNGKEIAVSGQLSTDAGEAQLALSMTNNHFSGHIETEGFQLGRLMDNPQLGLLATSIQLDGSLPINKSMALVANGDISHLEYNGYTYKNIGVDGRYNNMAFNGLLSIDDPNGIIGIDGQFDLSAIEPSVNLVAKIRDFNPEAFGIKGFHVSDINADAEANLKGSNLNNMIGTLAISDLSLSSPKKDLSLQSLRMDIGYDQGERSVSIDSDFGQVNLNGNYSDYRDLVNSIINITRDKVPLMPILPRGISHDNNHFTLNATITDSDWLRLIPGFDIVLTHPLLINGEIDERNNMINMNCNIKSFSYQGNDFEDTDISLYTYGDTLQCEARTQKRQNDDTTIDLKVNAKAADNTILSDIQFDNHGKKAALNGTLSSLAKFDVDNKGLKTIDIKMMPSTIMLNDDAWQVNSSDIRISNKQVNVDHLTIGNGNQHITINGNATDKADDFLTVDIQDLDFGYLFNILHVRNVDFSGHITGQARLFSLFSTPEANAQLQIADFKFVDGRIGDMIIDAQWNAHDKALALDGFANDEGNTTKIDGKIDLSPLHLDLKIHSDGTPLQFIERYCGSFLSNVKARGYGDVRIFGPSKNINMEGKMVVHGDLTMSSLNTTYTMQHDTITLRPDHLIFHADTITDAYGNIGIVNGEVTHTHLSQFGYDLMVNADQLLAYDFKEFGKETFCGTIFATGDCHIHGEPGETTLDINITPTRNTVFYYNAASPDALSSQEFIQWNDISPQGDEMEYAGLRTASDSATYTNIGTTSEAPSIPSDLRMNFIINANPDATLRLLMDEQSGDYIALNGSGTLRATYFNKGSFNLYGNYNVDHGVYKLTIQNLLRKDFQFLPESAITFGGDPYDATLALKASYTVNGVPLSDLNLGRSFTSNNIRVNCLMNINGTPAHPTVDFDMEMPTVSNDAQQMVRSLINSEEELNQQVIYLLAIGRFYNNQTNNSVNQDQERQSQTSLAMQSLLSGTISQQINTLLGSIINNNNWNFGANISTGDEGWNNAEYEGILSGRLLDNRLQINGQFGYRDNPNATTSFIGDFDIRYLLYPNGNLAVKVYNQTNDRYFIKNSLNTQGVGLIMKKDFNGWRDLLGINRKQEEDKPNKKEKK